MNDEGTDILGGMDEKTAYLTPIFASAATDAPMPSQRLNNDPIDPRVAYEMIREYLQA